MSSDPRSSLCRTKLRPGAPWLTAGGLSRPLKVYRDSFESPTSAPMNAPDSSVSMPDTPPRPMRGRTTQKRVSRVAKPSALFSSATRTSTWLRSSLSRILLTRPITTFLYFTGVLPASRPSALWKLMVTSGPACSQLLTTSDNAITAASTGISQISETLTRRRFTTGRGRFSRSGRS